MDTLPITSETHATNQNKTTIIKANGLVHQNGDASSSTEHQISTAALKRHQLPGLDSVLIESHET
eukprot:1322250-Amphidinium_carterae.1